MKPNDPAKLKSTALRDEIETIHRANNLFWERGAEATFEERQAYHVRQARLEEIRGELAQL